MHINIAVRLRMTLRRFLTLTVVTAVVCTLLCATPSRAIAEPSIDYRHPIRAAIVFVPAGSKNENVTRGAAQVITADLLQTGQFVLFDSERIKKKIADLGTPPPFEEYRSFDVQVLVVVAITRNMDDTITATYRLWDVSQSLHIAGRRYNVAAPMLDRLAHCIAADIRSSLTVSMNDATCQ